LNVTQGPQRLKRHVAPLQLPLVVLLEQQGADEPRDPGFVREDAEAGKLRAAAARPASAADPLSQLDRVLDRSHLMPPGAVGSVLQGVKAVGDSEPWPRFVCARH
jgi:hypothetical protein